MSKLYIVVAQSELVNWNATALAEVRACLIRLQSTLRHVLEHRDGIVAVRSLGRHGHNPHKTLKLYGMDGVALNRVRLALGRRLSARVYYNENDHVDFQDEFEVRRLDILANNARFVASLRDPDFQYAAVDPFEPETIRNWTDIFALNTIAPFFILPTFLFPHQGSAFLSPRLVKRHQC
ncbi:uncharacterized protein ARMOST_20311 [Armillaria ostoyae]|uniref:Uncharacterized protein n=1 Tax=Armillaria ostoyae TaxID=47428 RepID=A0A284S6Z5_ARMOS|nr:uncharacterized protein ARMOST_20311 [Armillaria ostoyae]